MLIETSFTEHGLVFTITCNGEPAIYLQADGPSASHLSDEKTPLIRSFHSSVLPREHSPSAKHFIFPLCLAEPKRHLMKRGPPQGALSGKRGSTRCELKRPSFGCLIYLYVTAKDGQHPLEIFTSQTDNSLLQVL